MVGCFSSRAMVLIWKYGFKIYTVWCKSTVHRSATCVPKHKSFTARQFAFSKIIQKRKIFNKYFYPTNICMYNYPKF